MNRAIRVLLLAVLSIQLTACYQPMKFVYPLGAFPLNSDAAQAITDKFAAMDIEMPFTFEGIPDKIPNFNDLNEAYAYTATLDAKYRKGEKGLIFWNTGNAIGRGGCGANGKAPYIYIGLPNEWTVIGVAKHIMHEIGHFFNLPHSTYLRSVMGPQINEMDYLNYAPEEWLAVFYRILGVK